MVGAYCRTANADLYHDDDIDISMMNDIFGNGQWQQAPGWGSLSKPTIAGRSQKNGM
jgi:hypothetical protein